MHTLTHHQETLVEVLSERAPLSHHGDPEVVAKESSQEESQQHQQKTRETLVHVVRVMILIVPGRTQSKARE